MSESPLAGQSRECAEHPTIAAIGRCAVCARPLCGDCSVRRGGTFVCRDTDHLEIVDSWILVHRTSFEFEADMISKNLGIRGIETKVFSSRTFKYCLGENPEDVVRVYVRRADAEHTREVLTDLGLENCD